MIDSYGKNNNYIVAEVAIDHPHGRLYDYLCLKTFSLSVGQLVLVPFRTRKVIGLVVRLKEKSNLNFFNLKIIEEVCLAWNPLNIQWMDLANFVADYYQKSFGEVAIPSIPKSLRISKFWNDKEKFRPIFYGKQEDGLISPVEEQKVEDDILKKTKDFFNWPQDFYLRDEQQFAIESIKKFKGFTSSLLFGVTGSGKTEVYLHLAKEFLNRSKTAQVLILVPEINLTPQLIRYFSVRFSFYGKNAVVSLHSRMRDLLRSQNWLSVHEGRARILIGTRLASMASFFNLQLIIVDEEHEASYKQQEGVRYSARDLCIWRAKNLNIPIVLGSASPSLETWYHAKKGHYHRFDLLKRASVDTFPEIIIIDTSLRRNLEQGRAEEHNISLALIKEINRCLSDNQQCLLFLNRRGFSPILSCESCDWIANCRYCSAYLVYHRSESCLRCHHCGGKIKIPVACPNCQNIDLSLIGSGTQRVEDELRKLFPNIKILRIDADSTRKIGSAEKFFQSIHKQEAQIIIGTNMISKGHDFKNIGLVGILNIDAALFSHDFRSSERIFSQLIQVSGRAGRDHAGSKVIIQTRYPTHPIFKLFVLQDYQKFADYMLQERKEACLPPFISQAVLRAEGKTLENAMNFLKLAAQHFDKIKKLLDAKVHRCHPVPLTMMKVANRYRAQLLVESQYRKVLQQCLTLWREKLTKEVTKSISIQHWIIEVDPLEL